MGDFLFDVRFALRTMLKSPGFTTVAVLTLAIAIGANTAIFSLVDGVLLKPLPFPEPDKLLQLWEKPPGGLRNAISALNLRDWKAQSKTIENLSAIGGEWFMMSGAGEPQRLNGQMVSASYFDLMGTKPAAGRLFLPDEDQPGKEQVVVLTHKVWQSRFGGDPGVLGTSLTLNNKPYTLIGVLPGGGVYDRGWPEIWVPLAFTPDRLTRDFHWLRAMGRLKPGVTIEQARAEMEAIAAQIAADYPAIKRGWSVTIDRFVDRAVGQQLSQSLKVMMSAVAAVLLIGCANLANLMLARCAARGRELAIRSSLGAGRWRLVRQMLTESVLLAGVGAIAGVGCGYGLLRAIQYFIPPFMLPSQADVRLDTRVLLFTAAIAALTGILFGIVPALLATRGDSAETLKEGGRGSSSGVSRHRFRNGLIAVEVALAFILVAGAGLFLRSFGRLLSVDPGFETTNILTMSLPRVMGQDTDGVRLNQYYERVVEQIRAVPGIRDVAVTSALPLQGWGFGMPFQIAGKPAGDRAARRACFFKIVSPSYFHALGMRLKAGRGLSERDAHGATPVGVINETMKRRYFGDQDPIGQRILIEQIITGKRGLGPEVAWEIVGVVGDEKVAGLDDNSPGIYVTMAQSPIVGVSLVIRGAGDPAPLTKSIQAAVWALNKDQALPDVRTLERIKSDSLGSNRLRTLLLTIFAGIALGLAAVGVYGVMSYAVAQRTQELGIRSALGASRLQLFRLVVGSGMAVAVTGLAAGCLGALGLTSWVETLLFNTSPVDAVTLYVVAGILAATALLACAVPAHRATRIDPVVALRHE